MPAPAPTELLAEDIKRLEESNQRVVARMDGVEAGLRGLREEFVGFRERMDAHMATIKWIGTFFAGVVLALVGGAVTVTWNASAVVSDVRQQGTRLEKIERRLDTWAEKVEKQLEVLIRRTEPKAGG
jgi:hypothetical protein